jgi:2-oxoglutarate dehydrogenase E1 component
MSTSDPGASVVERLAAALGLNAGYVVDLYDLYRAAPETVNAEWREYFRRLETGEIEPAALPTGPARGREGEALRGAASGGGPASTPPPVLLGEGDELVPLRGGLALIVRNMEASRDLPTATSYRHVPVKVLEENRRLLNHYLELKSGPKVSFTHLIAWAVLRALAKSPVLNDAFTMAGGEPHRVRRAAVTLGMAVDMEKKDGSRTLLVPNLRNAGVLDFRGFIEAYTRLIEEVRAGRLGPEAFQGTTISITNPGTVGTESSVPRLMPGQGAIIAVGSIGYSAETRAMSPELLSRLGIGKSMTISCTYTRIVQGGVRRVPR